jgi:predicted enzyme related to lactoylglutathione lyase
MNLNQITIYSENPVEIVQFYQMLGLRLIVDSIPRYARLECPVGDSTLSVHKSDSVCTNSGLVLYFECEDLDARFAELTKLGIVFDAVPVDQPWLWREAYLTDPAGNRICLFHAGDNRKKPPWRVK